MKLDTPKQRKLLALETMDDLATGSYNIHVDLRENIAACEDETKYYPPDAEVTMGDNRQVDGPVFDIFPWTTLHAAYTLTRSHVHVGVLNFASGKNPGGGFLRGTVAQEETIARSSTLYSSLITPQCRSYYDENKRTRDPRYNDAMIWSPGCLIFRNDVGNRLSNPYTVDIVTCAAPNYRGVLESGKFEGDGGTVLKQEIRELFRQRAYKVLRLFSHHEVPILVLGAWGCGVFGNDPAMVSTVFRDLLLTEFKEVFEKVIFAIPSGHNHNVFVKTLLAK